MEVDTADTMEVETATPIRGIFRRATEGDAASDYYSYSAVQPLGDAWSS